MYNNVDISFLGSFPLASANTITLVIQRGNRSGPCDIFVLMGVVSALLCPNGGFMASECTIMGAATDNVTVLKADRVHVLIGGAAQLGFCDGLGADIYNETTARKSAVDGISSQHPAYADVDPFDMSVSGAAEQLYAMGPLRGDNFVRYLVGDAWAIWRRLSLEHGVSQP